MQRAEHVDTSAPTVVRTFGPGRAVSGLEFERGFSTEGVDPFDEIEWELRSALIANERGELVFEQREVEFPKFWSQQATNIVVSKYFRGQVGSPTRERSVRQLIGRVVDTITMWAKAQNYFANGNNEWAAVPGLGVSNPALKSMSPSGNGSFKSETIPISAVGNNQLKVQQMLDRVGYK